MQLVNPLIMRKFIDAAQHGASLHLLMVIALVFIGIAVLQQAVSVGAAYEGEYVAWVATNELREDWRTIACCWICAFTTNAAPAN